MAEIENKWPYAFCPDCQHLCPVSDENGTIKKSPRVKYLKRTCLSCHKEVIVDTHNTVVFFDKIEAKLRKLPVVKDTQGEE